MKKGRALTMKVISAILTAVVVCVFLVNTARANGENDPPVAVCQDVFLEADENCVADASVDGGSFDPDGDPITVVEAPSGPYPLGETTVRLIVTDDFGLSDSCVAVVTVVDTTQPTVGCVETVNPHGQTVPPAGSTTLPGPLGGQNDDGFYELFADDNCNDGVEIFVNGFGPFVSGDIVKITEAPGATPTSEEMGSTNGQAGAIAAHLILDSDPVVTAVDAAGNVSFPVDCLVPPPPK
jgi:hypothetical protein